MNKNFILLLMAFIFSFGAFAQERKCATMESLDLRKQNDPQLNQRMNEIENFTQNKISQLNNSNQRIDGSIVTIPVVVHVLYRNSTENISAAQVQSQIDVLNEDFRRTNAGANNVWSQAADTEIEFCLVTVDPNGNATTGITRKSTTRRNWGLNDEMKSSATGGINPWNTSEYLNMWIVPQMLRPDGGTILGYAQFPGGSAATDGCVMSYNYFGRTGAVSAPFDGGRTTTHEIGHYFNLRHIWGDSNCGNDQVSDTPSAQGPNYGCATGNVSCGSTDMVQNYMDYSDDACMTLFTTGQKNRMRALLASGGARRSLALSDKCGAVATQPTCTDGIKNGNETGVDCGGSSCTPCQTGTQYCASQGNSVSDEYISNVKLGSINNNSGALSYSNFTNVSTDLNKGANYTLSVTPTWSGTKYNEGVAAWIDFNQDGDFTDSGEQIFNNAPSQTSPVTGTISIPTNALTGETRLRVSMKYNGTPTSCETFDYGEVEDYTVNIGSGGTTDPDPTTCTTSVTSFPYSESFESGLGSWSQSTSDDIDWTRTNAATPSGTTGPTSASQGSNYLFVEASVNGTGYPNAQAVLNSPCFNLASISGANFNFKYHMYGDADMGTFSVEVTTNGTTWTSLWSQTGNKGNNWLDASINLSAYAGQTIKLRFNRTTGSTWKADIAIDALSLTSSSTPADKCAGVNAYVSTNTYSTGDRVTFQGDLYERTPTAWTNLGACGTARIDTRALTVDTLETFELSIYPNPVKGNTLFIKSNTKNIDFTIVNMLGQQVAKGNTNNESLNVSNLQAGIYLIQLNINNTLKTKKFIKQ